MATTIQINSTIEAPAEQLYPYFSDLEKFGELHPLIKSVKKFNDGLILVTEHIPLIGTLGFDNKYVVEVIASPLNKVTYKIRLPLWVRLTIDFSFVPSNAIPTVLTETIVIKGIFPARLVLGVMIKKYHQMILDELKAQY